MKIELKKQSFSRLRIGKSQNRRLYPVKKFVDSPNVLESEKSSMTPKSLKIHRPLLLPMHSG